MEPTRLIIAGMPRCGTTLLSAVLRVQSDVRFVTDYVSAFPRMAERFGVRWCEALELPVRRVILATVRDDMLRLRHPVLTTVDQFGSLDDLHRAVMREIGGEGTRVVGHKTLLTAEEVHRLLDDTDVVCAIMLRDPRDAALSYWHRVGEGVEAYVADWKRMVRLTQALFGHPQLVAIRYEDLVAEPERALAPLSERLGIELDPHAGTLAFESRSGAATVWDENSAFGDVRGRFDASAVGRFRADMNSPIVSYAAIRARKEIAHLGYPPPEPLSPALHLRVARAHLAASADDLIRRGVRAISRRLRAMMVSGER